MKPEDFQLSENFRASEFACRCGCGFGMRKGDVDRRLIMALQTLRYYCNAPLHVNSGCRCKAHNAAIGGEPDSYHLRGMAADIHGMPIHELVRLAEHIPMFLRGGIGTYPTFVHLDVRGVKARWHG